MKIFTVIIILLLFQQSSVFGQTYTNEQIGLGLSEKIPSGYVLSLYTASGTIAALKNDMIPWQADSTHKKIHYTKTKDLHNLKGCGVLLGFCGAITVMGDLLVIGNSGGTVTQEELKVYWIVLASGVGAFGVGFLVYWLCDKYEENHSSRFSVISTWDHVGLAYNF